MSGGYSSGEYAAARKEGSNCPLEKGRVFLSRYFSSCCHEFFYLFIFFHFPLHVH